MTRNSRQNRENLPEQQPEALRRSIALTSRDRLEDGPVVLSPHEHRGSVRQHPVKAVSAVADPESDGLHRRGLRRIAGAALGQARHPHGPAEKPLRWDWSYEASPPEAPGAGLKARGTLITDNDPDGDGFYEVLRIEGRRNGVRITGLVPAGSSIPGNVDAVTGIAYSVDNKIQLGSNCRQQGQMTSHGIGFALADGSFSNLFFASYLNPPVYIDFHTEPPFPAGLVAPNSETVIHFHLQSPGGLH